MLSIIILLNYQHIEQWSFQGQVPVVVSEKQPNMYLKIAIFKKKGYQRETCSDALSSAPLCVMQFGALCTCFYST